MLPEDNSRMWCRVAHMYYKMFLSKFQNVFVRIAKCICPNYRMYLSKLQNVFVQIAKYICPNYKMYLSK